MLIHLVRKFKHLKDKKLSKKFRQFYETLNLRNGRKVLLWPAFFLLRRQAIGSLVVTLQGMPLTQFAVYLALIY